MDGGDIHLLLSILADGEEQARQLGEPAAAADDEYHGGGRGEEYYRGVARVGRRKWRKAINKESILQ